MRVALPLRVAVLGDVDLTADQRLHSVLLGLPVELDGPRQRAVVGERHRRHLELGSAGGKSRNAACPVENRVLGVDMQVNKRRLRHGDRV